MSSNALLRLWPFARPYAPRLGISMLAGVGMILASLTIPWIAGTVVDDLRAGRSDRLWQLAGTVLVMGTVEALLAHFRRSIGAKAAIGMERDLRDEFYAHLQRLPVSFHDGWQSGQLLSRAIHDLSTIRRFVGFGMIFLFLNVMQFAVVITLMVRLNAPLALITGITAVPIVAMTFQFNRRYHQISRQVQDDQGDLTTIIEESMTGIRIIKAFGRGEFMSRGFERQADVLHASTMGAVKLRAFFWSALRFLPELNILAVLGIGANAIIAGSMTTGELVAFITYLQMMAWPIRSVGWILANAEESRTGAERLFEVLDTEPSIADGRTAGAPEHIEGRLRLEHVSFRYPETSTPVLRDVNLTIEPGETVALVGATGSGKTTLAMLIPRLYDPTAGTVFVDDIDARDLTLSSLRSHIGVAFEESILFSMSVRENMLLGDPSADDEQIREALETAYATFVYDLPWGLDTRIGEQGYSLSGGQRQRLSLARAVLRKPQLLVLDDPLSAVDVHTEALIEQALASVLEGRTGLLVVHRPSTLALADRVAFIDGGTITDTGTHTDLMARNPAYADILSMEAEEVRR